MRLTSCRTAGAPADRSIASSVYCNSTCGGPNAIERREFIGLLGGTAAAWPLGLAGQQQVIPVVGFLNIASAEAWAPFIAAFRQGLSEAGYFEGRNISIEYRWADEQYDRLSDLAADLARLKVSVSAAIEAGDETERERVAAGGKRYRNGRGRGLGGERASGGGGRNDHGHPSADPARPPVSGIRSSRASAQRNSIATLWPSSKPASRKPLRNAARRLALISGKVEPRYPTTGIGAVCARAAIGHVTAPLGTPMNCRLLIQ
jgi:hypothetical protein